MPAAIAGHTDFVPEQDIPPLNGKVIFLTGGTAGIGKAAILTLSKRHPDHIYFSGRNTKAAQLVIDEIKEFDPEVGVTFLKFDMNSLASVKDACTQFTHDRLDILICNAGIMWQPSGVSIDGYERHFAINHLAHAMLIQQLLPIMLKTSERPGSDVRLLSATSMGWMMHPSGGISFDTLKTAQDGLFAREHTYGQSKIANIIYAREFARRYPQITTVSVHPGVVKTDLVNSLSMTRRAIVYLSQYIQGIGLLEESQGCLSILWAAAGTKKEDLVNGAYYRPVGVMSNDDLNKTAKDLQLAHKLWTWTEDVLSKF